MALLILSVLAWGFLHSLMASLEAKALSRRWLGSLAERHYRLAYNAFALVSFGLVLLLTALTPDRRLYLVPLPWSAVMILGQVIAAGVLVAGFRQMDAGEFIGLRKKVGPLSSRGGELLTTGLYRHVRHPLYSAGLAFIWLIPLMTSNILAINIGLSLYVVIGTVFEERKLVREFGEAYRAYQRETPMLIPRLFWRRNK